MRKPRRREGLLLLLAVGLGVLAFTPIARAGGFARHGIAIAQKIAEFFGADVAVDQSALTNGDLLEYNGTSGNWEAASIPIGGVQSVPLLDGAEHTDTAAVSPVRGDLVVGVAGPLWNKLVTTSTSGSVLKTDGTDLSWGTDLTATQTLAQTLVLGNATGGTNLDVTSGDTIDSATAVNLVIGDTTATGVDVGKSGAATTIKGTLTADEDLTATGQIIIQDGTAANPAIVFASLDDGTGGGFYSASDGVDISVNGVQLWQWRASVVNSFQNLSLEGNQLTGWDYGFLNSTAGVGAPQDLATSTSGAVHTNQGIAETNYRLLQDAAVGVHHYIYATDASDLLRVTATASDFIILNGVTSADGGFVESSVAGEFAALHLTALDDTFWLATEVQGSWSVDGTDAPAPFTTATISTTVTALDDARVVYGTGSDYYSQGESSTLTDGSASTIFSIPMADGDVAGVKVEYTIKVVDTSGDIQVEHGTAQISLLDHSGGVVAATVGLVRNGAVVETGTLTPSVWSLVTTDDQSVEVQVLSDSDLTVATSVLSWKADVGGITASLTVP